MMQDSDQGIMRSSQTGEGHDQIRHGDVEKDLNTSEKASDSPWPVHGCKPAIASTFGRVDLVPWLSVSYALASAACTLPWSKAYGTYSFKKLFIGATVMFMGASALCGGAPTINAFIVGRAIAGVGGVGMYMGVLIILSINTSDKERPRYLSLAVFWWAIGTVLGPAVGGAFVQSSATWRWAFYLHPCVGGHCSWQPKPPVDRPLSPYHLNTYLGTNAYSYRLKGDLMLGFTITELQKRWYRDRKSMQEDCQHESIKWHDRGYAMARY
ncbi:hypothetical protein TruAng_003903 [Truncatella angustata]|nr:hypothetical protein TruAng_003903 [Truncatella angustata]